MPDPKHILLRYASSLSGLKNTIEEHQRVLREHGAVWFGKMGRPFGAATIKIVHRQIEAREPSFLFLAVKPGRDFDAHRGEISQMVLKLPPGEQQLVPDYYGATPSSQPSP
jgi:hypothetical protein